MNWILLVVSLAIQLITVVIVIFTFRAISARKLPKLDLLERYHVMRTRYERLRLTLLFLVAIVCVQLLGLLYYLYAPDGPITLAQLLVSDLIFIALVIFLMRIYRGRDNLQQLPEEEKR